MADHKGTARRIAALMLALGVVALAVPDQAAAQGHFGVFGGANFANMGGDMDQFGDALAVELDNQVGGSWTADRTRRTGVVFGAMYRLPATPIVSLQIEGQYVARGTKFDLHDQSTGMSAETTFKLDYIEFPVLLRIAPPATGTAGVFFVAGPVIGFKSKADLEVSAQGQTQSMDMGEGFKSTTFGALGGIGLKIASGPATNITLQARYYVGLTNPVDSPNFDSKAGDFSVMAGVEFGLHP